MNATSGARASSAPRLRALEAPRLLRPTTWIRESRAAMLSKRARLSSLEPSSMAINSNRHPPCASTEATVASSVAAALYTGITTETSGTARGKSANRTCDA